MQSRYKFILFFLCFNFYESYAQQQNINVIAYYAGSPAQLDSFDAKKLTQIIFSFGHLSGNRFDIRSAGDTAAIKKMAAMKNINLDLKVLLSLGGWGGCETCSEVFAVKKNRKKFSRSVKEVSRYFKSDGIDLDWEYPAVAGFPGHKFTPEDRDNFTALIKRLRKTLGKKYEISFAAGVSKKILETGIDWKKVMKMVNRVNLMTYDLAGAGSTKTGHHTLLYSTAQQPVSTDYAVNYLIGLGVPANKLVIGAAFYGKVWDNVANAANGLYQPARFKSTLNYRDMVSQFTSANGYNSFWDDTAKAPFLYNSTQKLYVTYDDKRSVQLKTQYAIDKNLNGIMFWQLAGDNYKDGLLDTIDQVKKNKAGTANNR